VARTLDCPADEVSVAFVNPERIREYNLTYRGTDEVTDVLSFGMDDGPGPDGSVNLGDLVICPSRAAEQAEREGHPLWTELRILLLHGFLHLTGMDHPESAGDLRSAMELEEERLKKLLITD
jgi:probable rRNA maturation factor